MLIISQGQSDKGALVSPGADQVESLFSGRNQFRAMATR